MLNRMLVAATVIGAVSLAGASVTANAPQPRQQDQKTASGAQKPDPKKPKPQKPDEQKPKRGQQAKPEQKPKPVQQVRPQGPQAQPPQPRPLPGRPQQQMSPDQPQHGQARLAPQQQQRRIGEHQQELVQYRDQLDQQQRLAPQQGVELQRQHRTAQYAHQQQYVAGLNQQRASIHYDDSYDYGGDPYFYTPPSYRYARGGRYFETNEYGAAVLRDAVNNGYGQGFGAGRADRQDRWTYNYRDSYAYQDGIYGYRGFYVPRYDYRYYFRQGFRRGYEDGYYGRSRYGVPAGGGFSVLGDVLSVIINLQPLR